MRFWWAVGSGGVVGMVLKVEGEREENEEKIEIVKKKMNKKEYLNKMGKK